MSILAGIDGNISYYPSKHPQVRLDDLCVRALRAPHGVEVHRRQQEAQAQKVLGDLQVGILIQVATSDRYITGIPWLG